MLQNSTIRQRKAPPSNIRDAAGRMVKEGEKTFAYGWLDKVMQVAENGKTTQSYSYDISGQLATADYGDSREIFLTPPILKPDDKTYNDMGKYIRRFEE